MKGSPPPPWMGVLGAAWGISGFLWLMVAAVLRLLPPAVEALSSPLRAVHGVAVVAMTLGMFYSEGYRGFQRSFAPRFAARSRYLRTHPRWRDVVFAPLFCVGYYHASRVRIAASWGLTGGIVGLVLLVHRLPPPWRGLVDVAVVGGLVWGIAATVIAVARAHRGDPDFTAAQLPPNHTAHRTDRV